MKRCLTSIHQFELLRAKFTKFTVATEKRCLNNSWCITVTLRFLLVLLCLYYCQSSTVLIFGVSNTFTNAKMQKIVSQILLYYKIIYRLLPLSTAYCIMISKNLPSTILYYNLKYNTIYYKNVFHIGSFI